jgi:hypothetical protein
MACSGTAKKKMRDAKLKKSYITGVICTIPDFHQTKVPNTDCNVGPREGKKYK